jgi:hypothetical protein
MIDSIPSQSTAEAMSGALRQLSASVLAMAGNAEKADATALVQSRQALPPPPSQTDPGDDLPECALCGQPPHGSVTWGYRCNTPGCPMLGNYTAADWRTLHDRAPRPQPPETPNPYAVDMRAWPRPRRQDRTGGKP